MNSSLKIFPSPVPEKEFSRLESEVFIYETEKSCLGWFVYPNQNKQQGIGLHLHSYCDDVEIVLRGNGYRFLNENLLAKVPEGTVIINPPNSPHSFLAKQGSENVVVYGYRCPPEYTGTSLPWSDRSAHTIPRQAVELGSSTNSELEASGDNARVRKFTLNGSRRFPAPESGERTLVVMKGTVNISHGCNARVMTSGGIAVMTGNEELVVSSNDCLILLLEPICEGEMR